MSMNTVSPEYKALTEQQRKRLPECLTWRTEKCPDGTTPRGNRCANADNSSYRKGVCNLGAIWDKDKENCVSMAKDSVQLSAKRSRIKYERRYAAK